MVATLVVALHGAAFAASPKLALYPLKAVGTSAEAMQQLEAALRIELRRAQDLEIVEGPVARDCTDVACFATYGYSLQAKEVLSGEVRAMPDSYSVTMRLIDVASAKEIAHTAGSYNRDLEEMVWATRAQVARLKAPQRYAGQLVVEGAAGCTASVNGSPVTLGENLVLRAGLHEVRIERAGKVAQGWVEVRFEHVARAKMAGEPAKLAVAYEAWAPPEKVVYAAIAAPKNPPVAEDPLAPLVSVETTPAKPSVPAEAMAPKEEPKPKVVEAKSGLPLWPGIVAVVAGVGLAGGGIYELVDANRLQSDLENLRRPGQSLPPALADQARTTANQMNSAQTIGVALTSAGAAVAVGGALYMILSPSPAGAQVTVGGSF
ncbi:MAG: hypothetical protein QM765_48855 [Myxococcales bacterium]